MVALLVVLSIAAGQGRAVAEGDVEQRIADFWKRVDAMQPGERLLATDLGQWALNVIERDASARISVADFRVATAGMQYAIDAVRPAEGELGAHPPSGNRGTRFVTCFAGFPAGATPVSTLERPDGVRTSSDLSPIRPDGTSCVTFSSSATTLLGTWKQSLSAAGVMQTFSFTVTAPTNVEQRVAEFWKRVDALEPSSQLASADLGQWALNVAERDPGARLTVHNFRASTSLMQDAMDRARSGFTGAPPWEGRAISADRTHMRLGEAVTFSGVGFPATPTRLEYFIVQPNGTMTASSEMTTLLSGRLGFLKTSFTRTSPTGAAIVVTLGVYRYRFLVGGVPYEVTVTLTD